ncbi:MAG: hypothetical protein KAT68_04745 [Bacteroidales bacterium]|nr:hypothetical protein [Bacteroidales bacterium]
MIQAHIIKQENKPIAIVLDYKEYLRLKEIEEDKLDYFAALEAKYENKKWIEHDDLKQELGL